MDLSKDLSNAYLASRGEPTFVFFGPNANCTLSLCSPSWTVYGYRPSLGANIASLAIFFVAMLAHICLGLRWHEWSFAGCMVAGCVDELLGYVGRVWMFYDLWNFDAFMIQVVCITTAPVFYCAGIYVVLAKTISTFGPHISRFSPSILYWVFIPCDIVSLILQGAGGALSVNSSGISQTGVNIALAGLAFQVLTLGLFCAVYLDYLWRYYRSGPAKGMAAFGRRLRVFYLLQGLAIVLILGRCVFRVEELRDGYQGPLIKKEGLFIGLEGVPVAVAAFALCFGHLGLTLETPQQESSERIGSLDMEEQK